MDSKAVRMIVLFGVVALVLLAMMMMFTLDQVADTDAPQIAQDVGKEFASSLAADPDAVKLTMSRDGTGVAARRVYKLRLRPNAEVAADATALSNLMYHAAELCAAEIADTRSEVAIRCVAEVPDRDPKETIYLRDRTGSATQVIRAVAELPPVEQSGEAPKR